MGHEHWVWLSHPLANDTPVYGDGAGPRFIPELQLSKGDSCNTTMIEMQNHIGSHVDAPLHFVHGASAISDYSADDWVFSRVLLVELQVSEKEIIGPEHLDQAVPDHLDGHRDLVIFKTGFEQYRGQRSYWETPPGFAPSLADHLLRRFGDVKAIAMDTISISSFSNRPLGREAHHAFLGQGVRLFEDMRLTDLSGGMAIQEVIAMPLRFDVADGAPVSAVARVAE